jgi:hypothetical protein
MARCCPAGWAHHRNLLSTTTPVSMDYGEMALVYMPGVVFCDLTKRRLDGGGPVDNM